MTNETIKAIVKVAGVATFNGIVTYFAMKGIIVSYYEWKEKQETKTTHSN